MAKKPRKAKAKPEPRPTAEDWSAESPDEVRGQTPAKGHNQECCGTCHFWRDGNCKRYPPEKRPGQMNAVHRVVTPADDWCGEWRHAQGV